MSYPLIFSDYSAELTRNRLVGVKCQSCGTVSCPPRAACLGCRSTDLAQVALAGSGTIRTFTTNYVAPLGREDEAPYTIVMVELDEGPWIAGNLDVADHGKTGMQLIGKRVTLGHKVFEGDLYSAGPAARPYFSIVE